MIDFKKLRDLIIEKKCIASNDYGKDDPFVGIYWEDLVEIIKQCDTTKWISVEEALPKEDGWYLTLNINSTSPNFADTCQWNAKGKYWYTELCGDVFLHERTHWMQIPSLEGGEE